MRFVTDSHRHATYVDRANAWFGRGRRKAHPMKSTIIKRLRKFLSGDDSDNRCLPPKKTGSDAQPTWGFPRTQAPDLTASEKRSGHRAPGGRKG